MGGSLFSRYYVVRILLFFYNESIPDQEIVITQNRPCHAGTMNTLIIHDAMAYAVRESRSCRYISSVLVGDLVVLRIPESESMPAN